MPLNSIIKTLLHATTYFSLSIYVYWLLLLYILWVCIQRKKINDERCFLTSFICTVVMMFYNYTFSQVFGKKKG